MSFLRSKLEQLSSLFSLNSTLITEPSTGLPQSVENRTRMRKITGILLLSLALLMTFAGIFTPAVKVYVDGQYIGTASSASDVKNTISLVESQATEILGYDYTLPQEIETKLTITARNSLISNGELRNIMFNDIQELTNSYALVANGEIIGAADSREKLQAIIDEFENSYLTSTAISNDIIDPYSISYRTIPTDTPTEATDIISAAGESLTVQTVTSTSYTVPIQYSTETIFDEDLYVGEMEIVSEGVMGELTVSLNVITENGEFIESQPISSTVTTEPITQVVAMGTKARPVTASYGEFIWPVQGTFSSPFGYRGSGFHSGIDICNSLGTPISAADGGTVTYAGSGAGYEGYGNIVVITHDNGNQTYYAHLDSISVNVGDKVYRGQEIGTMGNTGRSTGVHLHFEIRIDGEAVDPMNYLPQ